MFQYPITAHKLHVPGALLANRNRQLIGYLVYIHMQSTLGTMYIHVPVLWCSFAPFGCLWNPENTNSPTFYMLSYGCSYCAYLYNAMYLHVILLYMHSKSSMHRETISRCILFPRLPRSSPSSTLKRGAALFQDSA